MSVQQLTTDRAKFHETFAKILGDDKFFGGAKPSVGDFWLFASVGAWELNTKGKEKQAHVYSAMKKTLEANPKMNAWANLMHDELKDYMASRRSGTI